MTIISYSQNFEDVILWRALKNIENGFYIDVGANDPIVHSVTKLFYENGWSGINCEPVAYWYSKVKDDRPRDINLQVAIGNQESILQFYEVVGTGLSTLNKCTAMEHSKQLGFDVLEYDVPVQTLESICKCNDVDIVHFLKVDVEGVEKDVLESFPFEKVRPWIVVVEATKPMTQIDISSEWEYILFENDYLLAYFDGLNKYYVSNEHSDLIDVINCPPNTFDDFILAEYQFSIWEKEEEVRKVEAIALKAEIKNIKSEENLLEANTRVLEAETRALEAETRSLKAETRALEAESNAIKVHQDLAAIMNSNTWKIFGPYRYFRRFVSVLLSELPFSEKKRRVKLSLIFRVKNNQKVYGLFRFLLDNIPFLKSIYNNNFRSDFINMNNENILNVTEVLNIREQRIYNDIKLLCSKDEF